VHLVPPGLTGSAGNPDYDSDDKAGSWCRKEGVVVFDGCGVVGLWLLNVKSLWE
jgi:hypothetical protein